MKSLIIKSIGKAINGISYISPKYAATKALELFSTPRSGKIEEHQVNFLNSAYKEEIDFDSINLMTYRWPNKGKTIMLAHGWESNSARWQPLIRLLQERNYNIIAMDAPAHGYSGGKEFNALLYSDCIKVAISKFNPYAIIGHSVGGMASVFALSNGTFKSVEKIILLGAPSETSGVFERYIELLGYNKQVENGINILVKDRYNKMPSYFSAAKFSTKISAKGLIIHDTNDAIIPHSDALLYESHFCNSKLVTTTGFGHSLNHSDIHNMVLDFIPN